MLPRHRQEGEQQWTTAHLLQLTGGVFEFAGLPTVAWGLSETRRAFTDKPSLLRRLFRPFAWLIARIRHQPQTVQVAGIEAGVSIGQPRVTISLGRWEGVELEERINQLRNMVEQHQVAIGAFDDRLGHEEETRKAADEEQATRRDELKQALEARIREAAAGGLGLEWFGVILFALGIILGTEGNLVGSPL